MSCSEKEEEKRRSSIEERTPFIARRGSLFCPLSKYYVLLKKEKDDTAHFYFSNLQNLLNPWKKSEPREGKKIIRFYDLTKAIISMQRPKSRLTILAEDSSLFFPRLSHFFHLSVHLHIYHFYHFCSNSWIIQLGSSITLVRTHNILEDGRSKYRGKMLIFAVVSFD